MRDLAPPPVAWQGERTYPHMVHDDGPFLVIGAGPKAVALAAKSKVLRAVGFDAPEVVAVERNRTAANWRAGHGWTNGRQQLGTLPEKDLGFPYDCSVWGSRQDPIVGEIVQRMSDFSWTGHLLSRGAYARWIDRGRPQPSHQEWADYLEWAAQEAGLRVVTGEVRTAETEHGGWTLTYTGPASGGTLHGRGLLVSGPGPRGGTVVTATDDRIVDTAGFWQLAADGLPAGLRHTVVVGSGETAGTVVRELALAQERDVTVVAPRATLYSRGESPFENRYYSDPTGWPALTEHDRREFIRRTDRAVFSQDVQRDLARTARVSWQSGRVTEARPARGGALEVSYEYGGQLRTLEADLVVDATGGDPMWFTELLGPLASAALARATGGPTTQDSLERIISHTLSVPGLPAPLHLPNLAALAQGPGFPNLSSLGLLSDRVLSAYVPSAPPADVTVSVALTTRATVPSPSHRGEP